LNLQFFKLFCLFLLFNSLTLYSCLSNSYLSRNRIRNPSNRWVLNWVFYCLFNWFLEVNNRPSRLIDGLRGWNSVALIDLCNFNLLYIFRKCLFGFRGCFLEVDLKGIVIILKIIFIFFIAVKTIITLLIGVYILSLIHLLIYYHILMLEHLILLLNTSLRIGINSWFFLNITSLAIRINLLDATLAVRVICHKLLLLHYFSPISCTLGLILRIKLILLACEAGDSSVLPILISHRLNILTILVFFRFIVFNIILHRIWVVEFIECAYALLAIILHLSILVVHAFSSFVF